MKFQVPRYVGLERLHKNKNGHWNCEFGFSEKTRMSMELDDQAMEFLKFCFVPRAINEIQNTFNMSLSEIIGVIEKFQDAGLLEEVHNRSSHLERYDRHLLFYAQNGIDPIFAQNKLGQCTVSLVGVGGIGNWVALNLVGLGLKEIRLIDFDTVELTNLTRQVIFEESSIGKSKIKEATRFLTPRNTQTKFTPIEACLENEEQVQSIIQGSDFVIVSADRPKSIHDWIDAACVSHKIPYINLGYRDGVGICGPLTIPGETSCYQCYKPLPGNPKNDRVYEKISGEWVELWDQRYQAPSFGPLNALVSTIGSLELIKYFCDPNLLRSKDCEISIDPISLEITSQTYNRDPHCWHCQVSYEKK